MLLLSKKGARLSKFERHYTLNNEYFYLTNFSPLKHKLQLPEKELLRPRENGPTESSLRPKVTEPCWHFDTFVLLT